MEGLQAEAGVRNDGSRGRGFAGRQDAERKILEIESFRRDLFDSPKVEAEPDEMVRAREATDERAAEKGKGSAHTSAEHERERDLTEVVAIDKVPVKVSPLEAGARGLHRFADLFDGRPVDGLRLHHPLEHPPKLVTETFLSRELWA